MAICGTNFRTLTRCNMLAFNPVVLLPAKRTLSYCCRHLPTSAKLSFLSRVIDCGPGRKNLLKPFADVLGCQHVHQHFTSNSVTLRTRTVHSSGCLYVLADSVTKCRLLESCRHTSSLSVLQRTLNKLSATSKHVHNSQTVSVNQSSSSKDSQKWSISGVVQQMVWYLHLSGFI